MNYLNIPEPYSNYLMPVGIVLVFLLIGLILEKVLIKVVKAFLDHTKWKGEQLLAKSFRGITVTVFLMLGLYTASMQAQLDQNVHDTLKAIFLTLIILLVTGAASRITEAFVRMYHGKYKGMLSSISIFTNIAKFSIFTIGFLIVLQTLGISITPILTALGVGGLAVALALKDSMANLFAGLHIIASHLIKPGDYIKINQETEGHVVDINWRSTVLKTLSNNEIIVPNAKVAEAIITNFSRPQHEMSVSVQVPVNYQNNLSEVEKCATAVAKEVAASHPAAVIGSEPSVKFSGFGDTLATLNISLRCKAFAEQYALKDELLKKLHARFIAENIHLTQ